MVWLLGIIFLLVLLVGGLYLWNTSSALTGGMGGGREEVSSNGNVSPTATVPSGGTSTPTVAPGAKLFSENTADSQNKILFLKNPDPDTYTNVQAWTMLPDGTSQENLNIPSVWTAYKHPGSSLVFYTTSPPGGKGAIFIKNLNTGTVVSITPIEHPDSTVDTGVGLENLASISPDGRYVMFSTMFTIPCPTPTGPPPEYMDGGPCQPEPDPNLPEGFYLYDVANGTRTSFGFDARVSTWDIPNKKLYLINNTFNANGLDVFDLVTKEKKRFDNATTFGYGAFYMPRVKKLIRQQGTTGDSGNTVSMSKLSIRDINTNQETEIDSGRWADIQPFASISPDETYVLYERSNHLSGGMVAEEIYRYNVATGEKVKLSPDITTESYNVAGVWIGNSTFITMVDTIESTNYRNTNNFLVSIDVPTGKITRLTQGTDVYRFTRN